MALIPATEVYKISQLSCQKTQDHTRKAVCLQEDTCQVLSAKAWTNEWIHNIPINQTGFVFAPGLGEVWYEVTISVKHAVAVAKKLSVLYSFIKADMNRSLYFLTKCSIYTHWLHASQCIVIQREKKSYLQTHIAKFRHVCIQIPIYIYTHFIFLLGFVQKYFGLAYVFSAQALGLRLPETLRNSKP